MGLTGPGTLVLAALVALAVPAAAVAGWHRLGQPGPAGVLTRIGVLAGCQLTTLALVGVLVNDTFAFYSSWTDLLGVGPRAGQPASAPGSLDRSLSAVLARDAQAGVGTMVPLPIRGTRSGVRAGPAAVYLPPQYGDPSYANRSFPVVELLSGFPGGPATWVRTLHLPNVLDSLIRSGRSAPFIAVVPVQNVASPRDTECVNVVGGPQVETYLTYDVRAAVDRAFRASQDGSGWTVLGDSTGGYCAADLALRHPDLFTAAVSIAGYNAPAHDATTRNLFGDQPELARLFSPAWLVEHQQRGPLHLLLISSKPDRTAYRATEQLRSLVRPPLQLATLVLPSGGHNFRTFAAELPVAFGWLSRYVPAPLAPLPTVDGLVPVPAQPRSPGGGTGTEPVGQATRSTVRAAQHG
jgi:enterochelin esterase-like enzyme